MSANVVLLSQGLVNDKLSTISQLPDAGAKILECVSPRVYLIRSFVE